MVKNKNKSSKPVIEIKEMHKWFGTFHVLKNISLGVNQGERIVICGPSGSGKSTLIRCINRLEVHQKGDIIVNDVELTGDLKNLESIRSDVGMVFQSFNLFRKRLKDWNTIPTSLLIDSRFFKSPVSSTSLTIISPF